MPVPGYLICNQCNGRMYLISCATPLDELICASYSCGCGRSDDVFFETKKAPGPPRREGEANRGMLCQNWK